MATTRTGDPASEAVKGPIRIMLVDDDPIQLKLHRLRLTDEGFIVTTARSAQEALVGMRSNVPHAIVSDVVMGDLDGFTFCRRVREDERLARVPLILLSAHHTDESDQELALRLGASALILRTPDFQVEIDAIYKTLLLGAPDRPAAADTAVYEKQLRSTNSRLTAAVGQAKRAERRYRALFDRASDVIAILSPDGLILESNDRAEDVFGLSKAEIVGRTINDFAAAGAEAEQLAQFRESVHRGEDRRLVAIRRPDGGIRQVEFATVKIELDGQPLVLSIGRDLTEGLNASRALAAAEQKFRSLVERIPEIIWSASADGDITFITPNVEKIMGVTREDLYVRGRAAWMSRVHPEDVGRVRQSFRDLLSGAARAEVEFRWRLDDATWIWIRSHAVASPEATGGRGFDGLFADVTERRRLEDGLRQAQKMEAIGQLTGGIAHDFNNILAVITANSHFLLMDLAESDQNRPAAEEIRQASDRAAALTRQLLAFSRRQVLEPTVLDLKEVLAGIEKMLRRVIGEDIDFAIEGGDELGAVRADACQVEQVIMNLVVNARDAMPSGGRLRVSTENVSVAADLHTPQADVPAGRYVVLRVVDSGSGMTAEVKRHVFEPFFTTKERGRGTGLGLSTCYGIVKQSGGHITIDSEVGRGTTFTIYLPRVDARPASVPPPSRTANLMGSQSVLLIEDDDSLRSATRRILTSYGYRVTTARDGREAVEVARGLDAPVDLVISDVIMPRLNGPAAVADLRQIFPDARSLFMSGYTDHALLRDGALRDGVNYIQKPFTPESLAKKIKEVLRVEAA
ncbi:MAG TPA: response regulator [Polyangia bacterium]|nr:response regulator [Polyangia bacterium]